MCGRIRCFIKTANAALELIKVFAAHKQVQGDRMNPSYIKSSFLQMVSSMQENSRPFVNNPGVDFTRKRKCSMSDIILSTLSMEAHSLSHEIRNFFPAKRLPTKSAFVQQRAKLNEKAFPHLFQEINMRFPFKKTFRGFHLLACDGSDINIPPEKGRTLTYVRSNTPGVGYHQVHLNAIYDVLEERYLDILIQPRSSINERNALCSFLLRNHIPGKCLFIADRGYYSLKVLVRFIQSGDSFLLRMKSPGPSNSFLSHFKLPDSQEFDVSLSFNISHNRKMRTVDSSCPFIYWHAERGNADAYMEGERNAVFHLSVRLVKLTLPDGQGEEYLLTNLPKESFGIKDLRQLYGMRWGIETSFRSLKSNVGLNHFHSIKYPFIIQEIYARVITYNLTKLLISCVRMPRGDTKYEYKVSFSDAVSTTRYFLIHRIINAEILCMLQQYLAPVRPDRIFPRKIHSKRFVPLQYRT